MNVIETSGLTRRFGKMTAVDHVDLAVPRGAVYGFLGANGAGKTTTIRLLLGLLRPDEGTISILESPLSRRNQNLLRRIGSLVENPSHYPHLTGRENLEVVRRLQGTDPRRIPAVLARMDLAADADRPVRQFSLGMRQRLGLAMALLGEPELLILDEPTNGLDPAGIQEMREFVRRLPGEDGITVFLSSHLLHEVEQIATRIGILRAGALLFQGTPAELHDRVQPAVTLEVDSPEKAARVLAADGWASKPAAAPGRLRVAAEDGVAAARINARLVAAGLAVSHLALERPSLEDIFLSLTHTREVPHAVPVASPAG